MTIKDYYENEESFEQRFYPPYSEKTKEASANTTELVKRVRGVGKSAVLADTVGNGVIPERSKMEATVFDPGFLQGYLSKNVGRRVRVEYLMGTNIMTDRVGVIEDVGVSYLVLRDQSGARVVSDLYSIKFVTFFE